MESNFILLAILILGIREALQLPMKIENDPNVNFIEDFMRGLPESDFAQDGIVLRHPSPDVIKFKNPPLFRNGTTVFNQKAQLTDAKKVIVLSGYDDNIRRSDSALTEQRVFVTLTQKEGTQDHYYVNYAYVRRLFPGEDQEGAVTIGGVLSRIELDTWDRRGADNNLETRMGWSVCSKSFFISCLGDPTRLVSYETGDEPDYPDELSEGGQALPDSGKMDDPNEPSSVHYYHGYFTDLADEFTHSWFVGASVIFATNSKLRLDTRVQMAEPGDLKDDNSNKNRAKRQDEPPADAPATEAPADAPATEAPADAPATEAPADAPATEAPADAPATEAPADVPATEAPADAPATEAPATEAPADASATEAPADAPATEASSTDTPPAEGTGDSAADAAEHTEGKKSLEKVPPGYGGDGHDSHGGGNKPKTGGGSGHGEVGANRGGGGQGGSQQPSREDLQRCLATLGKQNTGQRGSGMYTQGLQQPGGQNVQNGGGGRGRYGDLDDSGNGMFKPIDTMGQYLSSFAGYKPGQNSNRSPGTAFMNGIRNGANPIYGTSEAAADKLANSLGLGKVSNDRSHLDALTDDIWVGVTSVPALAIDAVSAIAKPLGLSPLLNSFAGLAGTVISGIGSLVMAPFKMALDFGKVGVKALGLGSLFGMRGASDNGGVKYCINELARIKQIRDQEQGNQFRKSAAGRSFGSKAVNMEGMNEKSDAANVDMFTPLGWRGLYLHQAEPFIGLGSCIVDDNLTLSDLNSIKTASDAVTFYLTTLRTNCNNGQRTQFLDLIKTQELIYNPADQTFSVSPTHFAKTTKKLLPTAAARFAQAFEMQEYTKAYVDEFRNPTQELRSPDNLLIHRAVATMRKMALNSFSAANKQFPAHTIKLMRNLLITLKSAFVRLLQSWQVVSICQRCLPQEQWVLGDDIISVLSVTDFIMYKFEPATPEEGITPDEVLASYEKFYELRRQQFANRLAAYVLPPYGRVGIPDIGPGTNVTFVEASKD